MRERSGRYKCEDGHECSERELEGEDFYPQSASRMPRIAQQMMCPKEVKPGERCRKTVSEISAPESCG